MLTPAIIEEILRRERTERVDRPQPQLDLPMEHPPIPGRESQPPDDRGAVIIPLWD